MIRWLLDPFQSPFTQRAAVACVLVGLLAPVVGTWVSLRRLAYMGDAMAHSVLGGVALGYAAAGSAAVLPGALAAGVVMAVAIHLLSLNRRLANDTVIAVVGSGMFALGVLLLSGIDARVSLSDFLFGQLLTVDRGDLVITAVLTAASLAWLWWIFEDLKLSTFDRSHSTQIGIRVQWIDASVLVLLAVCVVVCLSTVGTLLTVSLLVTPAATARLFVGRVAAVTRLAVGLGLVEVLGGFVVAYHADLAPGPSITVGATAVFVVAYGLRLGRDDRAYVRHVHVHQEGHVHVHEAGHAHLREGGADSHR